MSFLAVEDRDVIGSPCGYALRPPESLRSNLFLYEIDVWTRNKEWESASPSSPRSLTKQDDKARKVMGPGEVTRRSGTIVL
jgi:hypothetical protein